MMTNAHRVNMDDFPLIALLRLTCVGSPNLRKHGPHHLDSSNPRDKIFALLGLASDRKDLAEKGVNPDYIKTCREVYTLTTAAMLQQGHISLLSLIQPHQRLAYGSLPSWVPDWYQPLTEPLQIVKDDHMTLKPEFGASGTKNYRPVVMIDNDASAETFSWPEQWLVEVLRLTYQTKRKFPSFRERLKAVARASVGGVIRDRNLMGIFVRTGGDILSEATRLLRMSIRRVKDRRTKIEARKFLARRSLKRLPFVTVTGRLGLGYDSVKPGDVVAILRGAQVLFILRLRQTGKYNLISEAYVDEIMDGEALQGATFKWLDIV
ncbi:hypothetical protein GGR55DRAFT_699768 [Xylaria sp. FL0064]|nr:hypothetical protein GGR55DRAFT_699768 [Xylaria sp. FL0064]